MGVPKFYRWISERYPQINQIVSDHALLPEFDHLYLDMNGIIHGCTHPAHLDQLENGLSERDMMLGIMQYLDRIITQIVKPKVSVYMAIDGVAPRAKLNQQRSRRFRSAKDMVEAAQEKSKQAKSSDDKETTEKAVFDSNCITPGTEFLMKVSETIQYFIRKKIKEDVAWRNLLVIFSGPDIPGEGEHKIMSHIRAMRNDPNYQPNTRHCIYGQDADLIMLGLVTHEPHFTILREVVNFNSFQQNKNTLKEVKKFTKESDFQLLHLSLLREYLQIEFVNDYKEQQYDLERVIDDFVFMTFLVGNDFLPHMPTLDIGDGAFDLLFNLYKHHRQQWGSGQYLTDRGDIMDPKRLEIFIAAVGAVETEILEKREDDEAIYIKKRRKWDKRDGKESGPSDEVLQEQEDEKHNDYMTMLHDLMSKHDEKDYVDGWSPLKESDQKDYKGRYYFEKLTLTPVDKDQHWALRRAYMEGLRWCLAYYYKGCISWGWFYPYHYGPMLSDLINIPKMFEEIKFELGAPLTPFQQLMGCLPPASSILVPKLYRWLMTSPDSPIIQFYPENFEVDMNGKKNPWEGVNLLPFIDIALLKETIATHCPSSKLAAKEVKRNIMGKVCFYRYDVSSTDLVESPNKAIGLTDLANCHSSVTMHEEDLGLSGIVFEPKLIKGTQIPYPGFPSLNVMPIASTELIGIGLNCFGMPSKYPTMVLTMHPMPELPPVEILAQNVIGKALFVNWPMMHEGRVVAISDSTKEVRMVNGSMQVKEFADVAVARWVQDSDLMMKAYYGGNGSPGSGGINVNEIKIRLKVLPLQGMKVNASNGSTAKVFGREEADIPLQLALWQAPAPDPRFIERGPMTLKDRFPEGCNVVLTKGKFRGCLGTVVGIVDVKNVGVKVLTVPAEMPFGLAIARSVQEAYLSSYDAARVLKISPSILGKVMGRIPFVQGNYDLGLNLKSPDGFCVVGYSRKKFEGKGENGASKNGKDGNVWTAGDTVLVVGSRGATDDAEDERITWEYTPKAVRLVEQYRAKFPQLFAALNQYSNERRYNANQVFGPNGESWLPVVREWLDKNESAKLPRSPVATQSMSYEATAAVQKAADVRSLALKKKGYPKETQVKVPGSALYREASTSATDLLLSTDINDGEGPEIGDRIVNLCADGVPFGARGTVIGIHEAATSGSVEVVMDEEFIGGTSLQGHCANFRGKLCHWSNLLKIAPDNSQGLVDKLAPKGVKEAALTEAVNQIVATSIAASPVQTPPIPGSQSAKQLKQINAAGPAKSKTPTRPARSDSSGRSRQGGWKEARGPDEKSIGFKREGPSGLTKWRAFNKARSETVKDTSADMKQLATDLKQTLRIGNNVEDQLKAMLGVTGPSASSAIQVDSSARTTPPVVPKTSSVSEELKAILGVAAGPAATAPIQQLTTSSKTDVSTSVPAATTVKSAPTAAEKLLQILSSKQLQTYNNSTSYHHGPATSSPFNFTYFEEGKEPPSVPPNVGIGMPQYPMHQQPVAYHPNYAIPGVMHPMQQPMMYPGPAFGAPQPMAPVLTPMPVPVPKFTPPMDEFPPLSLNPPPLPSTAIDIPSTTQSPEEVAVNNPATNGTHLKPASVLVPSAVKIRK